MDENTTLRPQTEIPRRPKTAKHRRIAVIALKITLTFVLVGLILKKVGLTTLIERLGQADPWYLLGAAALSIAFSLAKSYKWLFLLSRVTGGYTYKDALRTYLIGIGIAVVTPARVGELGRAYYLREGDRVFAAGLVGVDRLLDLAGVFALACVGGFTLAGRGVGLVCVGMSVLVLAVLYLPGLPTRWAEKLLAKLPLGRKLEAVPRSLRSVSRTTLTGTLLLTFACYGLVLVEYYVLLLGFEQVPFRPVLLVFPLVMLTNMVQITLGGVGVREAASAGLFSLFGVSEAAAVNATFLIFLFNILIPGLVGAALSARHCRHDPR